jgi:hypothetical protein
MKSRYRYSPEKVEFLREHKELTLAELTDNFNARFAETKGIKAICSACKNFKIHRTRKGPGKGNGKPRLFTPEQAQFICENYADRSVADLTALFNDQFGAAMTRDRIKTFVHNRGITSGRTGQFERGQTSWNLGKRGYMGANVTSFKKGSAPANRKPIGTERIDSKDGFILVKIAEENPYTGAPTRYKHKHVHVWEQTHGKVPAGMVVAFKDGDKLNCDLGNLMLLTRAELLALNLHGYKEMPAELRPTVLIVAKLEVKAKIRTKPGRGRKKMAGR